MRDGYTYHLFSSNKRNDYAVLVEGTDEPALRYAALLAISLQNIKQYHDEKFDKANFIKNVVLDNHPARRYLCQGARAAFRNGRVPRGAAHPRLPSGADHFRLRRS